MLHADLIEFLDNVLKGSVFLVMKCGTGKLVGGENVLVDEFAAEVVRLFVTRDRFVVRLFVHQLLRTVELRKRRLVLLAVQFILLLFFLLHFFLS